MSNGYRVWSFAEGKGWLHTKNKLQYVCSMSAQRKGQTDHRRLTLTCPGSPYSFFFSSIFSALLNLGINSVLTTPGEIDYKQNILYIEYHVIEQNSSIYRIPHY